MLIMNWQALLSGLSLILLLSSCTPIVTPTFTAPVQTAPTLAAPTLAAPPDAPVLPATTFPTAAPTPTITSSPSPAPTATQTPTITPTPQPKGCFTPPDNMTRVEVNGWTLTQRTLAMLQHAQAIYGGELTITGDRITQGSYTPYEPASFGTHDGGGAVDLSVMRRGTWTILRDDIEPLIHALRVSGFAAWLRELEELYPGSPIHIHAVAIGDPDLSPAAQEQLTGKFGYFRGYTGVPIDSGIPAPDRHGGPVLCQWMIDMGYQDLREP